MRAAVLDQTKYDWRRRGFCPWRNADTGWNLSALSPADAIAVEGQELTGTTRAKNRLPLWAPPASRTQLGGVREDNRRLLGQREFGLFTCFRIV